VPLGGRAADLSIPSGRIIRLETSEAVFQGALAVPGCFWNH
jgi:hypothetical protein